jgi:hypothetical protein
MCWMAAGVVCLWCGTVLFSLLFQVVASNPDELELHLYNLQIHLWYHQARTMSLPISTRISRLFESSSSKVFLSSAKTPSTQSIPSTIAIDRGLALIFPFLFILMASHSKRSAWFSIIIDKATTLFIPDIPVHVSLCFHCWRHDELHHTSDSLSSLD